MLKEFLDPVFWFTIPTIELLQVDRIIGYASVAATVLGIACLILIRFLKNPVARKPFQKFGHLGLTMGLIGLFWFWLRYEVTPIFSERYWIGLAALIGLVWLIFVLKYLVFNFGSERKTYERIQVKNKYMPGQK